MGLTFSTHRRKEAASRRKSRSILEPWSKGTGVLVPFVSAVAPGCDLFLAQAQISRQGHVQRTE